MCRGAGSGRGLSGADVGEGLGFPGFDCSFRVVGASAVEGCRVAYLVDDVAFGLLGDLGREGFPLCFVFQVFDLDEFVVVEGLVDVGDGGFGDAVFADLDSGFEAVSLFLEVSCLSGCELVHGGVRVARFLNWFLFAGGV